MDEKNVYQKAKDKCKGCVWFEFSMEEGGDKIKAIFCKRDYGLLLTPQEVLSCKHKEKTNKGVKNEKM